MERKQMVLLVILLINVSDECYLPKVSNIGKDLYKLGSIYMLQKNVNGCLVE